MIILMTFVSFSQEMILKVECNRTSKVLNYKECNGLNALYYTHDKSIFIHNDYPIVTGYSMQGNMSHMVIGDEEKYPIFTDLATDSVIQKISYLSIETPFKMKYTIVLIDCEIKGLAKNIEGIRCLSAEGIYGGREYEVWFSPDIPVPFGPHRLWGGLGLIIKAKSKDGFVNFEFISYETALEENIVVVPPLN